MYRTHTCGELRIEHVNQEVTLSGWVQEIRKMGTIAFVTLRDRYGVTQLYFNEQVTALLNDNPLGREFVISVNGTVIERASKNANMPTGDIELLVKEFHILNKSAVPPFTIKDETDGGDDLRMKYRYLDLRRGPLQNNISLRFHVGRTIREYLNSKGFMDIETPFLIKSTPEGARDFVVPSRMNEGQFYALPQSPQTFKQLLMVSGYDRYYQIVKCFRDEDLRADRQPEFTQVDCEMSFVEQEDVLQMFEGLLKYVFKEIKNIEIEDAFPRITWTDAMWNYGNDKPDIRFDMKIQNLKVKGKVYEQVLNQTDFKVIADAESVLAINATGCATYTRKQLDELTDWVKRPQIGMQGLMYIKCNADGTYKSSVDKFFTEEQLATICNNIKAVPNDLVLILTGKESLTRKAICELRLEMGNKLGLRNADLFKPLWVLDFPLFEWNEEDQRFYASHHPFTSPKPEHIALMDEPARFGEIFANAYDIVLNGTEVGGGSIRIYQKELQEKMFKALGMSKEEAQAKFGFLLGAFEYGAPPHGGLAFGFDRLCALLGGDDSIRDYIAFPKNNSGRDMMLDAPSSIDNAQLDELSLKINLK